MAWLDRLLRLGRWRASTGSDEPVLPVGHDLWQWVARDSVPVQAREATAARVRDPLVPEAVRLTAAVALPEAEERAFSVWEQLAGDPGAQAMRAQWESRWEEF